MTQDTAQQKQINTDIPVEIIGYITDPKRVGYQILTNYESTYWRRLVGRDSWALYEVLRSFCHQGNDTCTPSINLLMDILDLSDRRLLIGRVTVTRGKERVLPGLIDTLQDYNLAVAEVKGKGPKLCYVFHVNLTPSVLTTEQVKQLPQRLQRKHADLLQRVAQAVEKLDTVERKKPPSSKDEKSSTAAETETGEMAPIQREVAPIHRGVAPIHRGVAPIHSPSGTHPPITIPNNNTQQTIPRYTTLETTSGIENHHSSGEPDPQEDVVVALTSHGLSKRVSQRLADRYKRERIFEKIDYLEYLREHDPQKVKNPVGWLRRAIEENYSAPDGYKSKAEREAEAAEQDRRRQQSARAVAEEERRQQDEQEQTQQAYAAWLAQMQKQYGTTELEVNLWPQALDDLELQLPRATYQAWFARTQLLSLTDSEALIAVPNPMTQEWLEHRWAVKIKQTLADLGHPVERLRFSIADSDCGLRDCGLRIVS